MIYSSAAEKCVTSFSRDRMSPPLQFFMVFLLQLEAVISGTSIILYHRVGDDVTLSSNVDSSYYPCSDVHWFYHRDKNAVSQTEFNNGKKTSSRAGRLSLCRNCSLVIKNITADDAGRFTCRIRGQDDFYDTSVSLNILTISPSPPDADASRGESITLKCSLLRFDSLDPCEQNSLRWMDEAGTELLDEGDGYEFRGQMNCVSVKHQRNRRFTCQFVQKGSNVTFAEYKLDFTDVTDFTLTNTSMIIGLAVGMVTVILAAITFLSIYRVKTKPDQKKNTNFQNRMHQNDDPENNTYLTYASVDEFNPKTPSKVEDESEDIVTYVAVDHSKPKTSFKVKVKEEEDMVTYSAVRTKMKAEVDSNLSGLSSSFRKTT